MSVITSSGPLARRRHLMSAAHTKVEENNSPAADPKTEPVEPPRRLLLVEDDEYAREQLQKLLRADSRLEVTAFGDGEQALRELAQRPYSIVITDLRMPRCDGMDLIREVQKRG